MSHAATPVKEIHMIERKEPKYISWDAEGERVQGILLKIGTVAIEGKKVAKARLQDDCGNYIEFLCPYSLANRLSPADLGHLVSVSYEGTDPNISKNGNAMKTFRVSISEHQVVAAPLEITDADIPF